MLFPTMRFLLFFIVVFAVAWRLQDRPLHWRLFILASSYAFYSAWDVRFVGLLIGSSVVNWGVALLIDRNEGRARRAWLVGGVVANLGTLAFFKYWSFFIESLIELLPTPLEPNRLLLAITLPVAISFFTFQGIAYLVDTYRGEQRPVTLVDLAVLQAFFPHLVAGPIVRVGEFVPQLHRRRNPDAVDTSRAFRLIARGLFKKVVVATFVAEAIADPVFAAPGDHGALETLVAMWAYAVQIYADFSGYTDMAIGLALLLGIRFPDNFDRPYTAASIQEFWRRWHMTLSRWLRDYLYIPLGGNQRGEVRTEVNLIITMALGGLWHGASWVFVIWGLFHGIGLAVERRLQRGSAPLIDLRAVAARVVVVGGPSEGVPRPRGTAGSTRVAAKAPVAVARRKGMHPWLARILVFHFVCVGWVFFRAPSLTGDQGALTVLGRLVTGWTTPDTLITPLVLLVVTAAVLAQYLPDRIGAAVEWRLSHLPPAAQGVLFGLFLVLIDLLGPEGVAPFIYFQF